MILEPDKITKREKLVLAGLFLSKFDKVGLAILGFETFTEAFNVIGFALRGRPASIKNYRDEFDPLYPNPRVGWQRRSIRPYCAKIQDEYESLDTETFAALVMSFVAAQEAAFTEERIDGDESRSSFARRLMTGLAAERYFESLQPKLIEFSGYVSENTTRLGCGCDFRLRSEKQEQFLAVEVKGLSENTGSLSFTPKEHHIAETLADRFFLFVVKNFRESPYHQIYRDPLASPLIFQRKERSIVQVSWLTNV